LSKHDPVKPTAYSGAVGKDKRGEDYVSLLTEAGIKALVSTKNSETGYSIIIVTPDYERTMFTYLGACREFEESDIDFKTLASSAVLHIAGYMWDTDNQKKAVRSAIRFARENGVKVSFDLADPFVVNRNRSFFPGSLKCGSAFR
jgi:sugar/nucleoside kinase (ribokinase family)